MLIQVGQFPSTRPILLLSMDNYYKFTLVDFSVLQSKFASALCFKEITPLALARV